MPKILAMIPYEEGPMSSEIEGYFEEEEVRGQEQPLVDSRDLSVITSSPQELKDVNEISVADNETFMTVNETSGEVNGTFPKLQLLSRPTTPEMPPQPQLQKSRPRKWRPLVIGRNNQVESPTVVDRSHTPELKSISRSESRPKSPELSASFTRAWLKLKQQETVENPDQDMGDSVYELGIVETPILEQLNQMLGTTIQSLTPVLDQSRLAFKDSISHLYNLPGKPLSSK